MRKLKNNKIKKKKKYRKTRKLMKEKRRHV
jgi:hypothetical protein